MSIPVADAGAIRFAERLLGLLDQGQFTATYKYAVLLGLMDLCLEHTQQSGTPPAMIRTHQLADKIIELYWPQTRPFHQQRERVSDAPAGMLQQNTGKHRAVILRRIGDFRGQHAPDPSASLHRARLHAPDAYARLRREVEWTLVKMPLPKAQRVGRTDERFVYQIAWDDRITRARFNDASGFDNRVHFVGSAAELLVRLSGLLRPMIQRQWAAMVARLNQDRLHDAALEAFLFGVDRRALEPVRAPLLELQAGRCFYCDRHIRDASNVDHFLPWVRYPDNGLDNLVVAHEKCNHQKRDFLAAAEHVAHWRERNAGHDRVLQQIARDRRWERDTARTSAVVRGIYLRLPDDVPLWRLGSEFVPVDRGLLAAALGAA